jgi:LmbE family N-acetylglucosaminyl deacetylase
MQKLNVLGSVLYIVAHPDDENTKLIAWLANGKKVRTGNLSLTRGDGGQNLIGPELGDALGIIRTQELMEARRIDGGEQFFTRAVDFGFSKNAAESFEKWGKQEVLSDVVRVIRTFRPDVIITRFAPDRSAGHGHHEASAILAEEAFDLAGDPKAFPEQLEQGLEVWQPRRLFFNGSTWWKKDLADIAKNDPDWFSVDVGGYDPLLGLSYTEIAGRSRSMHKSQGFGAAETRGESLEYLKLIKGDRPKTKDIFEGIDMTWGRVSGSKSVSQLIIKLLQEYSVERPAKSVDRLRMINATAKALPDSPWREITVARTDELSIQCAGLVIEALAPVHTYPIGLERETLKCQIIVRGEHPVTIGIYEGWEDIPLKEISPPRNQPSETTQQLQILPYIDQPHWLSQRHEGIHSVGFKDIGKPVVGNLLQPSYFIKLGGGMIHDYQPALYKWVDRVAGERIRPVYVTPRASVLPKTNVLIARGGTQTIDVEVEALSDSLRGDLRVSLPEGWATTDDLKLVNIAKRNDRQSFTFQLSPLENAKPGAVRFEVIGPQGGPNGRMNRTLHEIDYPHIMPQVYYTPAEVKLVPMDVKTTAKRVGYVKGAGDDVPQAMEQLGVAVEFVEPEAAKLDELLKYDAIVVGIRAYNSNKGMKELHPLLLQYVEQGGTLVVQYNTTPRFFSGASDFQIDPATLGPHPFTIGRGRVTVEEAPPTFLDPKHPLLNTPNTITTADFEGWVQERGLYFASDFGTNYTPLIAWNDPGEDPLNGALIVADHGKGRFIYTGISFFRQLPAGVPGAYRLWANLISRREVK